MRVHREITPLGPIPGRDSSSFAEWDTAVEVFEQRMRHPKKMLRFLARTFAITAQSRPNSSKWSSVVGGSIF
jgi:hypothetical protein